MMRSQPVDEQAYVRTFSGEPPARGRWFLVIGPRMIALMPGFCYGFQCKAQFAAEYSILRRDRELILS
jgi:hypothetical protein